MMVVLLRLLRPSGLGSGPNHGTGQAPQQGYSAPGALSDLHSIKHDPRGHLVIRWCTMVIFGEKDSAVVWRM
jgi:hypothetical protein